MKSRRNKTALRQGVRAVWQEAGSPLGTSESIYNAALSAALWARVPIRRAGKFAASIIGAARQSRAPVGTPVYAIKRLCSLSTGEYIRRCKES